MLGAVVLVASLCAAPLRVAIDSGHHPTHPGALSASGEYEMVYNDRLAEALRQRLVDREELRVTVIRGPGEDVGLGERVARLTAWQADLVVSLHHDSVQPQFLEWVDTHGEILPRCLTHRGFSLFVPSRGAHRVSAQRLARAVADGYLALGLVATDYHALPIRGENRRRVDAARGIYAGDHLFLLRKLDTPVVLVESGFLVHPDDDARLRDPAHVAALAEALAQAVVTWAARGGPQAAALR